MSEVDYSYSRLDVDYSNRKKEDLERPFEEIGNRINEVREKAKVMRKDFAAILNVPSATYTRVSNGVRFPDYHFLTALREKYNVDMNWLLFGEKV